MNDDKFSIRVYKGDASEILEFPVKPTNSTKAVLVQFDTGTAWILTELFRNWRYRTMRGKYCLDATVDSLPELLQDLKVFMRDDLVPLKKAGKGPTEKSHKFRVVVLREKYSHSGPYQPEYESATKTLTLGWFAVSEINGKYFGRRNVVEEKLENGCILPRGARACNALKPVLEAAAMRVAKDAELKAAENMKRQREHEAIRAKQKEEARAVEAELTAQKINALLPMVSAEGDNAISFCRKHFTDADMQRKLRNGMFSWNKLPASPLNPTELPLKGLELIDAIIKISKAKIRLPDKILEGATVKWVDWVGPSSRRQCQENEADGCTVKFYGLKRVIICQDGDEITKMEGPNLEITGGTEIEVSI